MKNGNESYAPYYYEIEMIKNGVFDKDLINKIGLIMCNEKECNIVFNNDNLEECVSKYPNKLIVTLGSNGLLFHNGERIVKMPSIDVDVIDVSLFPNNSKLS